jgi:protein ImuB
MSSRARRLTMRSRPFVVASGGHYPRVVAANGCARAAGIRSDQLISAALAFAPDVVLRDRDPHAEAAALAEVATLLLAFTPQVSLAHPNAVVAEIEGSVRLFGGLAQLLAGAREKRRVPRLRCADGARTNTDGGAPARARRACAARAATQRIARSACTVAARAPRPRSPERSQRLRPPASRRSARRKRCRVQGLRGASTSASSIRSTAHLVAHPIPVSPTSRRRVSSARLALPAPIDKRRALGFGVNRLVSELAGWLLARGLGVVRMSLALVHERYVRDRGTPPSIATFRLGAPGARDGASARRYCASALRASRCLRRSRLSC